MLFNSIQFLIFFPLVVAGYYLLPPKRRWMLLLAASYYFYMSWRPEYLLLILLSTVVDYFAGLQMGRTKDDKKRRRFLFLSLFMNLGLLFTFKYFNFFRESLNGVFELVRVDYQIPYLKLLLPVGISFYTFQTLSYTIDVYRGKMQPEKHFGIFALYVAFFPQLVAGPIERAVHLLPQFHQPFRFEYARVVSGLRLMLWGFFKKLVIADRIATIVNSYYADTTGKTTAVATLMVAYFFAIQIFCDFSAYSDIAIGAARVMGYDLMTNFRQPFFAKSIAEFWRRWHISLSTWFRDYVYFPLGGGRVSPARRQFNMFFVFLISGLWHGAAWTFVIWGALHGIFIVVGGWKDVLWQKLGKSLGRDHMPSSPALWRMFVTFNLFALSMIIFRSVDMTESFRVLSHLIRPNDWLVSPQRITKSILSIARINDLLVLAVAILVMESVHLLKERQKLSALLTSDSRVVRWGLYYGVFIFLLIFGKFSSNEAFIYFQF